MIDVDTLVTKKCLYYWSNSIFIGFNSFLLLIDIHCIVIEYSMVVCYVSSITYYGRNY